jgi:hypothetical protein
MNLSSRLSSVDYHWDDDLHEVGNRHDVLLHEKLYYPGWFLRLGVESKGGSSGWWDGWTVENGTAWLPVCHLRGLAKSLPGCIAGIQGARQTFLSSCLIQLPSSLWPFLSALIPIRCADADWLGPLYSLDRGPYANHPTNCRSRDHDAHVLPGTALVRWYKLIVNFSWTGISLPRSCLHLLQSDDIAIN